MMPLKLIVDRESFVALKELLRDASKHLRPTYRDQHPSNVPSEESVRSRICREAMKRVFEQIRDVEYRDGVAVCPACGPTDEPCEHVKLVEDRITPVPAPKKATP